MKKVFVIAILTTALLACNNEKKPGEETTIPDTTNNAPSQAAGADSIALKAMADSTTNPADSTQK